jgi:hypothetical protein
VIERHNATNEIIRQGMGIVERIDVMAERRKLTWKRMTNTEWQMAVENVGAESC